MDRLVRFDKLLLDLRESVMQEVILIIASRDRSQELLFPNHGLFSDFCIFNFDAIETLELKVFRP